MTLFTRDFYIPKEARLHLDDKENAVQIYRYEREGVLYGLGFVGKTQKPTYAYRFRSEDERAARENYTIAAAKKRIDEAKARRAARAEFKHNVQVGDVMHCSWGWEQTNNDFYQVIAVKNKSVVVRKIAKHYEASGWAQGNVTPLPNQFLPDAEPITRKVTMCNGININSYQWARKCEMGRSFHESSYA